MRKRNKILPKFLKIVKIIQYYSILFIRVLSSRGVEGRRPCRAAPADRAPWRASGRACRRTRSGRRQLQRETRRGGRLWRARSRLYRSQILQVNMRLKALAEIYTMHSNKIVYDEMSKVRILSKNCDCFQKKLIFKQPNFAKFSERFAIFYKN